MKITSFFFFFFFFFWDLASWRNGNQKTLTSLACSIATNLISKNQSRFILWRVLHYSLKCIICHLDVIMRFVRSATAEVYIHPNLSYFVTGLVIGWWYFVTVFGCSMTEFSLQYTRQTFECFGHLIFASFYLLSFGASSHVASSHRGWLGQHGPCYNTNTRLSFSTLGRAFSFLLNPKKLSQVF